MRLSSVRDKVRRRFPNDTPEQHAQHCAIECHYERHAWLERQRRLADPLRLMTIVRVEELERIFVDLYGLYLPDDDAGWDDLVIMAHHLAHFGGSTAAIIARIVEWAALWAPTFPADKVAERAALAAAKPIKFKADTLAWRLRLSMERRTRLKITSIGAFDVAKEDRPAWLRAYHRQRKEDERRAKGARPRAEYLAAVKAKEPWLARGMSRSTWYRRGKPGFETASQPVRRGPAEHTERKTTVCRTLSHKPPAGGDSEALEALTMREKGAKGTPPGPHSTTRQGSQAKALPTMMVRLPTVPIMPHGVLVRAGFVLAFTPPPWLIAASASNA